MQNKPLNILFVEDSQDDVDLILLELNENGFDIFCERIDTEAGMRSAMKRCQWDIVISDFNLPRFSASGALSVLRETETDTPFILVSGCIGEESAVALMREGASDFVMKDKLARLAPAVERELRKAAMRREHRQAQKRLRENEKLLDGITAALGEGIFVLNGKGALVFMNPEAERLLGWAVGELRGKDMHAAIHSRKPDGTPLPGSCCKVLEVLKNGGVCRTEEDAFLRSDGSFMPVSFVASAIMENGKAVAAVVAFQDISRRKQAEQDLLESREQLRELSMHQQSVREEERARIARELHDELGQMLTAIKLDANWLATCLSKGDSRIVSKIDAMSGMLDKTLDAVRRVASDLRPVMLDDLGLAAAVEWLVEEFCERTGIAIRLEMDMECWSCQCHDVSDRDAEVSTAAFRIVQECLTNAIRHAEAGQMLVSMECHDGKLMLMVSDNGRGMILSGEKKRNALGIIGMRERAHAFDGTFHLFSIPGDGTTVVTIIPIKTVDCERAIR